VIGGEIKIRMIHGFKSNKKNSNSKKKMNAVDVLNKELNQRKKSWWDWHKNNPSVWDRFEAYTLEAIESGRRHYSHWAIVNRIRWNTEIETKGGEFKISNDYIGMYARLFHARYPQYDGFFKLKPLKEEKEIQELRESGIYAEPKFNF